MNRLRCRWIALGAFALLSSLGATAQVSLYTVVDMALRNSTSVRIAQADVMRAAAGLTESKDAYIPNLNFGSSLGYSYGFPLGEPSVFNVSSQSLLYTFSQPDYIRSARAAVQSAEFSLKDAREQVVLDASLDYIQLNKAQTTLATLDQEKEYADKLVSIEEDRVLAGVENRMELTKAKLTSARIDLQRIHLQNDTEMLRQQLAHLTGLPAASFVTNANSIPSAPRILPENEKQQATMQNAGVQAAQANAKSKQYVAFGDARQIFRPQFYAGGNYSLFAKFNNYNEFYQHFQYNNFDIGVQIKVTLFDAAIKARERRSAADFARASAQADQARDTTNEQIFQLQKSLTELAAQQRVTQLQAELAQDQLDVIATRLADGSGSPGLAPLTPKDEQQAHIEERERYADVLDANYAVLRAELSLLRSTGSIEDWAKSGAK
ncbi:MAG TPA: TolC family protein [Alloacidobacterium sp.]|nr:TolC family protein [Alloacidobacterium sp.]